MAPTLARRVAAPALLFLVLNARASGETTRPAVDAARANCIRQLDHELARILEIMERHSKRLALLVDDLLVLAQLESATPNVHFGKVRVAELFHNVLRDWEKKFAEKQLKVIVDLPAKLPAIRGE